VGRVVVSKVELLEQAVRAVCKELAFAVDQPIVLQGMRCASARRRPCGAGGVQISFKLAFEFRGLGLHGALLLPLSESLALAARLLLLPEELVELARGRSAPDESEKEVLLELGKEIASALERSLGTTLSEPLMVRSSGCQGVRAGVRPNFPYREGDELWVARFACGAGYSPPFEGYLILPSLATAATRSVLPFARCKSSA